MDPIIRLNAALEGRYRIERELGEGGMATVYLADDLKHERKVALKVLKPELAAVVGAERFLAEIKTTANLQHPHILALYDSGEADGLLFYVMPYVEGESLRERLERERQLPVDDAVRIATNLAEALDYAHRQGVIHRDIKPANVMLQDGKPVIADFGIALAVGAAGGGRLTETGLSLGTPHYMSPEQATGDQNFGPATDIYALGCVLYEMLVGEPPFTGSTPQAVLGRIITGEVPSAKVERASVPPNVDAVIAKALEKVPADRFGGAAEIVGALGNEGFRYWAGSEQPSPPTATGRGWTTWGLGVVAAVFALLWGRTLLETSEPQPVLRVAIDMPTDQSPAGASFLDLSRDGSLLVYQGVAPEGRTQLWARRLDALDAVPITGTTTEIGTTGTPDLAISPDGTEVAFWDNRSVYVIPIEGGTKRTVVADSAICCLAWSPDGDWIYYQSLSTRGLSRAAVDGGRREDVTAPDLEAGETGHTWPHTLPGGRVVLFQGAGAGIAAVDVTTGRVTSVIEGRGPRYIEGHLLFTDRTATTLSAVPFDAEEVQVTGDPVTIVDRLQPPEARWSSYAASLSGDIVYVPPRSWQPVWVSLDGAAAEIQSGWRVDLGGGANTWALSPSGDRFALGLGPSVFDRDVWTTDLGTGVSARLTSTGSGERPIAWLSSDSLLMVSDQSLWAARWDGAGSPRLVVDHEGGIAYGSVDRAGRWLVFVDGGSGTGPGRDLYAVDMGRESDPIMIVESPGHSIRAPALSPDGRLLAYSSNENRRVVDDIIVRSFPDVDTLKINVGPGTNPAWSRDGSELFFISDDRQLTRARISSGPDPRVTRETLFPVANEFQVRNARTSLQVAHDGRFVMMRAGRRIVLVRNLLEELRTRADE